MVPRTASDRRPLRGPARSGILLSTAAGLAGVVCVALRLWLAWPIRTSWIGDEAVYAALARSLYSHLTLDVLGAPAGFYSLVYPALLGATMLPHQVVAPAVLKLVQFPLLGTTALVVYGWGRTFLRRRWALAAALLTLALPGLSYASLAMSEVAYVPLFALALWTIQRTLESPSLVRQGLMLGAIALVSLTRLQGLVLVPIFAVSLAFLLVAERQPLRHVLGLLPAVAACALAVLAALVLQRDAGSTGAAFGAYTGGTWFGSLGDSLRWALVELALTAIGAGVLPFATLVPLLASSCGERAGRTSRTSTVVIAAAVTLVPLQAGLFIAGNGVNRPIGRYCLAVLPAAMLGFAAWGAVGFPRKRAALAAGTLLTLAVLLALPGTVFAGPLPWDSLALVPEWRLGAVIPAAARAALMLAAAAALSLLWLSARVRRPLALAAVVVWLVSSTVVATRESAAASATWVRETAGADPRWLDQNFVFRPKTFLFSNDLEGDLVGKAVFWNQTLDRVAVLPLSRNAPGPFPQAGIAIDSGGVVHALGGAPPLGDLVVASPRVLFQGVAVVRDPDTGLVLWSLSPPARVLEWVEGWLAPDRHVAPVTRSDPLLSGWSAKLFDYRCSPTQHLRLRVVPVESPGMLTVDNMRRVVAQFRYRPGHAIDRVLPVVPDARGYCQFWLGATSEVAVESFWIS